MATPRVQFPYVPGRVIAHARAVCKPEVTMVISDFRFNSFVAAQLCDLGKIGHRLQQFGALCHETVQTLGVKVPVPDAPRRPATSMGRLRPSREPFLWH
jgi:hypothetical protein